MKRERQAFYGQSRNRNWVELSKYSQSPTASDGRIGATCCWVPRDIVIFALAVCSSTVPCHPLPRALHRSSKINTRRSGGRFFTITLLQCMHVCALPLILLLWPNNSPPRRFRVQLTPHPRSRKAPPLLFTFIPRQR